MGTSGSRQCLDILAKARSAPADTGLEELRRDPGIEPDEIAGKTDFDFYPRESAEKYREDDQRLMESGQTEEIEEQFRRTVFNIVGRPPRQAETVQVGDYTLSVLDVSGTRVTQVGVTRVSPKSS